MKPKQKLSIHYFLRSGILMAFAFYIVYLGKSGNMVYYIAPRMEGFVKWSAVGLYAMAVYQLYLAIRLLVGIKVNEHGHPPTGSWFKHSFVYGLFILPLFLALALPDMALNSALAAKKGMSIGTTTVASLKSELDKGKQTQPNEVISDFSEIALIDLSEEIETQQSTTTTEQIDTETISKDLPATVSENSIEAIFVAAEDYLKPYAKLGMKLYKDDRIYVEQDGFIEIISAVDLFVDNFIGKEIELSGFIYREEEMRKNQFVIARFEIQCCSADALPFGLMVELDDAAKYATDTWVNIVGTIGKTEYNGNEIMKIDAKSVTEIPEPSEPYVYFNFSYISPYYD